MRLNAREKWWVANASESSENTSANISELSSKGKEKRRKRGKAISAVCGKREKGENKEAKSEEIAWKTWKTRRSEGNCGKCLVKMQRLQLEFAYLPVQKENAISVECVRVCVCVSQCVCGCAGVRPMCVLVCISNCLCGKARKTARKTHEKQSKMCGKVPENEMRSTHTNATGCIYIFRSRSLLE